MRLDDCSNFVGVFAIVMAPKAPWRAAEYPFLMTAGFPVFFDIATGREDGGFALNGLYARPLFSAVTTLDWSRVSIA